MERKIEAYQYGKRLGKETTSFNHKFLKSPHKWTKVKGMLRELSGFKDNKNYGYDFVNDRPEGVKSDSYRVETENSREILNDVVIPYFRKGFIEGLNE